MLKHEFKRNQAGFALMELVAIIVVVLILLALLIWPNMIAVRAKAQRVNCLSNMTEIWKAIEAWELSSGDEFRPWDDETKGIEVLRDSAPQILICPAAGRVAKTNPVTNSYYQYYSGRRDSEGDKVIICDMNGPNQVAGPNAWGGNHGGKGGNIIKVSGAGMWVDALKYPGKDCITNPAIANSFSVNEGNNIWPLTKSYRSTEPILPL